MASGNTWNTAAAAEGCRCSGPGQRRSLLMGSLATRNYLLACVESLPGVTPALLLLRQGAPGCCCPGDIEKCVCDTRTRCVLHCTFIGLLLKLSFSGKMFDAYETM